MMPPARSGDRCCAIAGSLLAEISIPKLITAWLLLIALPAVLLGLAPLIVSGWLAGALQESRRAAQRAVADRAARACRRAGLDRREAAHSAPQSRASGRSIRSPFNPATRSAARACGTSRSASSRHGSARRGVRGCARPTAAGAGLIVCVAGLLGGWRWRGRPRAGSARSRTWSRRIRLVVPALANAVVLVGAYLAAAALVWGIADATMDQPRDLAAFDLPSPGGRSWRVAHLSDLHVVGERYGFRIESGRSGPRGNERLARVLARLDAIHAEQPLDLVLITGDMTDAGRSAEWAEFLTALATASRSSAERTLMLPGNHDINVVDRANPARLDLPTSPGRRLRQMRTLSAMAAVQGDRVRVVDAETRRARRHAVRARWRRTRRDIAAFADAGTLRLSARLARVWADVFPMVLPPDTEDGLGVILLNSNAETHFSFTNALGLVSAEQSVGLAAADPAVSAGALDRGPAPPPRGISEARRRPSRSGSGPR